MGKLLAVFVLLLACCGSEAPMGDCGPNALLVEVVGPDGARLHQFQGTLVQPDEFPPEVTISCPGEEGGVTNCERGEIWVMRGGGSLRLQSGDLAFYADLPFAEACDQPYTARLFLP